MAQVGLKIVQGDPLLPVSYTLPQPPGSFLSYTSADVAADTDSADSKINLGEESAGSIHRYIKAVLLQKGTAVRLYNFMVSRSRFWLLSSPIGGEPGHVKVVYVNGASYGTPATNLITGTELTETPAALSGWELTEKGDESPLLLTQVQVDPLAAAGEYRFYTYLSWEEEV